MNSESHIARQIAAEDIRPGQYIVKLRIREERGSCSFESDLEMKVVWELPWDTEPFRVLAVCLPYVMGMDAEESVETLDVRRYRFAHLPEAFGRIPFDLKREKQERERNESAVNDTT